MGAVVAPAQVLCGCFAHRLVESLPSLGHVLLPVLKRGEVLHVLHDLWSETGALVDLRCNCPADQISLLSDQGVLVRPRGILLKIPLGQTPLLTLFILRLTRLLNGRF